MKQIIELNSLPKQQYIIVTEDNSTFTLNLEFLDNQAGWFFSIVYGTFTLINKRLTFSPNILRQWKNILPFGLSVLTADFTDPFLIDDFTNSRVICYLLTSAEVLDYENNVYKSIF